MGLISMGVVSGEHIEPASVDPLRVESWDSLWSTSSPANFQHFCPFYISFSFAVSSRKEKQLMKQFLRK
jgi:hypothetical protein